MAGPRRPNRQPGINKAATGNPQLDAALQSIQEIIEVGAGLRPDRQYRTPTNLDQWVRLRDLIDIGLLEDPQRINRNLVNPGAAIAPADAPVPEIVYGLVVTSELFKNILTWEQPTYDYFSYVEVWRAEVNNILQASLVGTAGGPIFNDEVGATGTLYYWVRAVSTQGKRGPFNDTAGTPAATKPVDPPTNVVLSSGASEIVVADDGTVIARVRITWDNSVDTSVKSYEIQYKKSADATWQHWTTVRDLSVTDELIGPLDNSTPYDVRIRALRLNNDASTWVTVTDHTVAGKLFPPDDVTGFVGAQVGSVVEFDWDDVTNPDLFGYELRFGVVGSAWEDASPLTRSMKGTSFATTAMPSGTWTVFNKSVDTSNNYATNAATLTITVTSDYDIIYQVQQAPDWLGTIGTDGGVPTFVRHPSGVLVPNSQNLASDDDWETFDEAVPNPYPLCVYTATEIDAGFDDTVRLWGTIESALLPGETGVADPKLWVDHRLDAGSYDGFEQWTVGQVDLRYALHQLQLDTTVGLAKITGFLPTVDLLEHKEVVKQQVVAAGGTSVAFSRTFHVDPSIKAWVISAQAAFVTINNITTTGCTFHVFDVTGTDVGGTIGYEAEGV